MESDCCVRHILHVSECKCYAYGTPLYNDLYRNGLSVRIYGIRLTAWRHGHDSLITWWRHQMETFSALLAICAGNSPVTVNSLHKGQWRGALMFSLICAWMNGSVNSREADDLRRPRPHCDVTVMSCGLDEPRLSHVFVLPVVRRTRRHVTYDKLNSHLRTYMYMYLEAS